MILTAEHIDAMRDWMLDCQWREDPDTLADLPDAAVVAGVARHYAGGVPAFLADGGW